MCGDLEPAGRRSTGPFRRRSGYGTGNKKSPKPCGFGLPFFPVPRPRPSFPFRQKALHRRCSRSSDSRITHQRRLPGIDSSGMLPSSSPVTAVGPSPIRTGFPFHPERTATHLTYLTHVRLTAAATAGQMKRFIAPGAAFCQPFFSLIAAFVKILNP